MIYDCHVHMRSTGPSWDEYLKRLDAARIDKSILLSCHPTSFRMGDELFESGARLDLLMDWAGHSDRIIPFYWIDPLEEDALAQVDAAVAAGVSGFKVICNRHYPCEDRPMQVWAHIAKANKPILFHSGILYSNTPSSSYNRPAGFEGLFDIPNLRYAMAHVSWPWHDECLAVYGKWCDSKEKGLTTAEMFIDTTPGTPRIYREEVIRKLYTIGYGVEDNVIFGTDCSSDYSPEYALEVLKMDAEALDAAQVTSAQREKYYHKNLLRFLGKDAG